MLSRLETQGGARWNETLVKSLTGGDPVKADFMRQDNFVYTPEFKLVVLGNYKPSLRSVNDAMRRRLHLIPFNIEFEGPNRVLGMEERLQPEWPGILRWAIEGCLLWQASGLEKPATVQITTDACFGDQDATGDFLAQYCTHDDPNAFEELETCTVGIVTGVWRTARRRWGRGILPMIFGGGG